MKKTVDYVLAVYRMAEAATLNNVSRAMSYANINREALKWKTQGKNGEWLTIVDRDGETQDEKLSSQLEIPLWKLGELVAPVVGKQSTLHWSKENHRWDCSLECDETEKIQVKEREAMKGRKGFREWLLKNGISKEELAHRGNIMDRVVEVRLVDDDEEDEGVKI